MSTSAMQEAFLKRPAPKQRKETIGPSRGDSLGGHRPGQFNIWYGKKVGREEKTIKASQTRCRPALHSGYTRAGKGSVICVFFAQGRCDKGSECQYYHRTPNTEDEVSLGAALDVFGRERFARDRDDMGGIGTFSRANRTLYVGRINTKSQKMLAEQFGEFGTIESIKVLEDKGCAFVKYSLRAAAEFAKEAMDSQILLAGDECINLRWATEDPNPGTQKRTQREMLALATAGIEQQGVCIAPSAFQYPAHYHLPPTSLPNQYPDTDAQFVGGVCVRGGSPCVWGVSSGCLSNRVCGGEKECCSGTGGASGGEVGGAVCRPPPPHAPPPPPPPHRGRWARAFGEGGCCYFYNVDTNETVWQLPPGAIEVPPPPASEQDEEVDGLTSLCGYDSDIVAESDGQGPRN